MSHEAHEQNRQSWNAATPRHNSHKGDQAAFLRVGGGTLFTEELGLLGELSGKRLLHLQCNSGQDSLSLAKRGAAVTGVDISDEAIAFARGLSAESGIPGDFVRADVLDYLGETEEAFDLVFSSYGFIGWLSNLDSWAHGIARVLAPGGRVVLMEFHSIAFMFDEHLRLRWPYSTDGQAIDDTEGVSDYVARAGEALLHGAPVAAPVDEGWVNPHRSVQFGWGIGDLLTALLGAGLRIDGVQEYGHSNGWRPFEGMVALPGRRWALPEGTPAFPLMFSVVAGR